METIQIELGPLTRELLAEWLKQAPIKFSDLESHYLTDIRRTPRKHIDVVSEKVLYRVVPMKMDRNLVRRACKMYGTEPVKHGSVMYVSKEYAERIIVALRRMISEEE